MVTHNLSYRFHHSQQDQSDSMNRANTVGLVQAPPECTVEVNGMRAFAGRWWFLLAVREEVAAMGCCCATFSGTLCEHDRLWLVNQSGLPLMLRVPSMRCSSWRPPSSTCGCEGNDACNCLQPKPVNPPSFGSRFPGLDLLQYRVQYREPNPK